MQCPDCLRCFGCLQFAADSKGQTGWWQSDLSPRLWRRWSLVFLNSHSPEELSVLNSVERDWKAWSSRSCCYTLKFTPKHQPTSHGGGLASIYGSTQYVSALRLIFEERLIQSMSKSQQGEWTLAAPLKYLTNLFFWQLLSQPHCSARLSSSLRNSWYVSRRSEREWERERARLQKKMPALSEKHCGCLCACYRI